MGKQKKQVIIADTVKISNKKLELMDSSNKIITEYYWSPMAKLRIIQAIVNNELNVLEEESENEEIADENPNLDYIQ